MMKKDEEKNKKDPGFLDHEFDGIKEKNNPIPLWFSILFIVTIIFAAIYFIKYHIIGDGTPLMDEYNASIKSSNTIAVKAFKYSEHLKDIAMINAGKINFDTNCAACHGDKAQGLVGPNLTDDYWIANNTYVEVQKVIANGVASKGMPGWASLLGDKKIKELMLYIISIQGTNPSGTKPLGSNEKAGKLHE